MTDPSLLPAARAWIGTSPYPWPALTSLRAGDAVTACYALVTLTALRTRQEKPYLRVQLMDRHGAVEGRVWDDAEAIANRLQTGGYVGVRGRLEIFNGERQLKIEEIAPVSVPPDELELFLPRSTRPAAEMDAELATLIASVRDAGLRRLLESLLGADTATGPGYRIAPAAKRNHHAYLGGLLEHSLSVARVCDFLAPHYGAGIDRDLLITAALLHDIGKIREIGAQAGFPYTDEGKLLGHILLGLQIVNDAGAHIEALPAERLLLVQHLIASHQGRYEWQSPREPRILEGLLLHYADDLDAKMNQAEALVAATQHGWTGYDRSFAREFLRHVRERRADEAPDAGPGDGPEDGPGSGPGDASEDAAGDRPGPGSADGPGAGPVAAGDAPARDTPAGSLDLFEG